MLKLENLKKDGQIRGLEGTTIVRIVSVEPVGDDAVNLHSVVPDGTPIVVGRRQQLSLSCLRIGMTLKPWYEIAKPHKDVLEGAFKKSEFIADISQVAPGIAPEEHQDVEKFYARTFITEGMRLLLVSEARRLAGQGGDSVIQLQAWSRCHDFGRDSGRLKNRLRRGLAENHQGKLYRSPFQNRGVRG